MIDYYYECNEQSARQQAAVRSFRMSAVEVNVLKVAPSETSLSRSLIEASGMVINVLSYDETAPPLPSFVKTAEDIRDYQAILSSLPSEADLELIATPRTKELLAQKRANN